MAILRQNEIWVYILGGRLMFFVDVVFISIYLLKIVGVVDGVQIKICGYNGDVTLR